MTEDSTKTEPKKKNASPTGVKKTPVHVIRDGGIAASIWERTTEHGMTYLEYTLSRSWKNKKGASGYSQAFFPRNEAALINVVKQAAAYIAEAEARQNENDSIAA